MKSFKLLLATLGVGASLATAAVATDLDAYRGQVIDLGDLDGIAYYTVEKDGYRVVATLANADSKAIRFEVVLAPGQTVVLSTSAASEKAPTKIEISRQNGNVQVVSAPLTN